MNKLRFPCHICGHSGLQLCIFPSTGTFYCYRCRAFGRVQELPKDVQNAVSGGIPLRSAAKARLGPVCALAGASLPLPGGFKLIDPGSMGWDYLQTRNISDPSSLAPFVGEIKKYIIFPIWENGNLVYYVGRKMWGTGLRYMNAEADGSPYIFAPYTMELNNQRVVVTEGIFDALTTRMQLGIPTIALLNKSTNNEKTSRILEYVKDGGEIIICLDPESKDPDVIRASTELLFAFKPFRSTRIVYSIYNRDLADLDIESKRRLLDV